MGGIINWFSEQRNQNAWKNLFDNRFYDLAANIELQESLLDEFDKSLKEKIFAKVYLTEAGDNKLKLLVTLFVGGKKIVEQEMPIDFEGQITKEKIVKEIRFSILPNLVRQLAEKYPNMFKGTHQLTHEQLGIQSRSALSFRMANEVIGIVHRGEKLIDQILNFLKSKKFGISRGGFEGQYNAYSHDADSKIDVVYLDSWNDDDVSVNIEAAQMRQYFSEGSVSGVVHNLGEFTKMFNKAENSNWPSKQDICDKGEQFRRMLVESGKCLRCDGTGYFGPYGDTCSACEGSGYRDDEEYNDEEWADDVRIFGATMINRLIKIANDLDEKGFHKEADKIDALIKGAMEQKPSDDVHSVLFFKTIEAIKHLKNARKILSDAVDIYKDRDKDTVFAHDAEHIATAIERIKKIDAILKEIRDSDPYGALEGWK